MNNWINRLAIFAVVGAILSSAVLVGCGKSDDEAAANTTNTTTTTTTTKDEGG